ncbi:hypothetical protein PFISCL1PPCAC_8700, partial [Pristionchus fissidentatus]
SKTCLTTTRTDTDTLIPTSSPIVILLPTLTWSTSSHTVISLPMSTLFTCRRTTPPSCPTSPADTDIRHRTCTQRRTSMSTRLTTMVAATLLPITTITAERGSMNR